MENIVSIVLFITLFLSITGVLYTFLLKNEELKKRLNYYLDIENKFKRGKAKKDNSEGFKEILKNSNESIREVMKRGLPGKDQKRLSQLLTSSGVTLKPEEYVMFRFFSSAVIGGLFYILFNSIL